MKRLLYLILGTLIWFGCKKEATIDNSEKSKITITLIRANVSAFGASDGAIDMTISGTIKKLQYVWSNGATTEDLKNINAGKYYVSVLDSGQILVIDSIEITQPDPTKANIIKLENNMLKGLKGTLVDYNADGILEQCISSLIAIEEISCENITYIGSDSKYSGLVESMISQSNYSFEEFWFQSYNVIGITNMIIDNVDKTSDMTTAEKNRVKDYCSFIRAYLHYELSQIFGNIPLVENSYKTLLAQSSATDLYYYLISSLSSIQTPTYTYIAQALLARIYLQNGDYSLALTTSEKVINSGMYSISSSYNDVFEDANSKELIWGLTFDSNETNSISELYVKNHEIIPTQYFIDGFEKGDNRKSYEITGSYIRKYLNPTNLPLIKYSEIILVASEAAYKIGNNQKAVQYLNMLRSRSGVSLIVSLNDDILKRDRLYELAFEGFRFSDLKRYGEKASYLSVMPIPQKAMDSNIRLIQNPGY